MNTFFASALALTCNQSGAVSVLGVPDEMLKQRKSIHTIANLRNVIKCRGIFRGVLGVL
jgi:hypothetical protein